MHEIILVLWSTKWVMQEGKSLQGWEKERLKAGGEGDNRGQDGWVLSLTQWTWVWESSRRWWRTGKPGMLHPRGRKESDTTEQLNNNNNGLCMLTVPTVQTGHTMNIEVHISFRILSFSTHAQEWDICPHLVTSFPLLEHFTPATRDERPALSLIIAHLKYTKRLIHLWSLCFLIKRKSHSR